MQQNHLEKKHIKKESIIKIMMRRKVSCFDY